MQKKVRSAKKVSPKDKKSKKVRSTKKVSPKDKKRSVKQKKVRSTKKVSLKKKSKKVLLKKKSKKKHSVSKKTNKKYGGATSSLDKNIAQLIVNLDDKDDIKLNELCDQFFKNTVYEEQYMKMKSKKLGSDDIKKKMTAKYEVENLCKNSALAIIGQKSPTSPVDKTKFKKVELPSPTTKKWMLWPFF